MNNNHLQNFSPLLSTFIKYLQYERRYSALTIQAYQRDLTQFFDWLNDTYAIENPKDVTAQYVRSWMVSLVNTQRSSTTIARKLSALKSFYKFLVKRSHLTINPVIGLHAPRAASRLPVFLEEEKMEQLLNNIPFENDFEGARDKLILELFYATGMRRNELISLQDKDIDFDRQEIRVKGKGNKERILPLSPHLLKLIKTYMGLRDDYHTTEMHPRLLVLESGKALYPQFVYRLVKRYLNLVSTKANTSPHTLRHTFATNLLNRGADLNSIKTLLGHSSLASTEKYTHNSFEKLKEIYKQTHPKA